MSLRGLTHSSVVQQLRSTGNTVTLTVRPNQILEGGGLVAIGVVFGFTLFCDVDIFSGSSLNERVTETASSYSAPNMTHEKVAAAQLEEDEKLGPLPPGWARKVDHKTGRPYYEK